jgi:hypothetical protein
MVVELFADQEALERTGADDISDPTRRADGPHFRHNEQAIGFYRKHGFEIDPSADCAHAMPLWTMRRNQAPA